jgi:hypothetical protein
VFEQDITKHTVAKDKEVKKLHAEQHKRKEEAAGKQLRKKKKVVPVTVTTKVTKRPYL